MSENVIRRIVILKIIAISYIESAISILVVNITLTWLVCPNHGVIVFTIPRYCFYTEGRMFWVKNFKLSIFIAAIKDEVATMIPTQPITHQILWLGVDNSIIPSSVLHHHSFYLCFWRCDSKISIFQIHRYLLMTFVDVVVGIGSHRKPNFHQRFNNHKADSKDRCVVIIIVNYSKAIVATYLQPATFVRYL